MSLISGSAAAMSNLSDATPSPTSISQQVKTWLSVDAASCRLLKIWDQVLFTPYCARSIKYSQPHGENRRLNISSETPGCFHPSIPVDLALCQDSLVYGVKSRGRISSIQRNGYFWPWILQVGNATTAASITDIKVWTD